MGLSHQRQFAQPCLPLTREVARHSRDGGIVGYLLLTIPQSFCFAKIQPPLHKGAFFTVLRSTTLKMPFFLLQAKLPLKGNAGKLELTLDLADEVGRRNGFPRRPFQTDSE